MKKEASQVEEEVRMMMSFLNVPTHPGRLLLLPTNPGAQTQTGRPFESNSHFACSPQKSCSHGSKVKGREDEKNVSQ